MPYTKSAARKEFEDTIKEFHIQVGFASKKKNKIIHDIRQCVYRNAIFQASAALEEYVGTILEDWIHMLHLNEKTILNIPKELCIWAVAKRQKDIFGNFLVNRNEEKFISKILAIRNLNDYFNDDVKIKHIIPTSEFIGDKKYPSQKNLKTLFNRFGIKNIFLQTQIKGKKDYKSILKSFNDIRTEIAHQHPTPDLSSLDTKNNLDAIKDFVFKIDRVLYSNVVKLSGSECWKLNRLPL